nr:retrovirus-related Pol polyprotein from transposon TNT 1-94 [Tanacetum cinerariifolium]
KNYVRKFLRALHPKWRAKVTKIKESKDLSSLALDELIRNLKLHEVVMEKDFKIYKGKKERIKSIALKAKKESSDDETLTSGSDDEEYAMAVKNFKKFFRRKGKFVRQPREERKSLRQRDEKKGKSDRKCFRYGDLSHLISDFPKISRSKDQKAFIGGSWSDSENDAEDKTNDETCLMDQSLNEISLKKEILKLNKKIKKLEKNKEIEMACKWCDELILENAKLKETQVKFDKSANSLREMLNNHKSPSCKRDLGFNSDKASTSGTKTMSFVRSFTEKVTDGSTIKGHGSALLGFVSRKDSEKGTEHVFSPPMSSRSDFVIIRKKLIHNSIDESKKPSLKPSLKSGIANDVWELIPLPLSQSVIGTKWGFRNKLDENRIVSRNKARLVAQGYNKQEGIDYDETYAPVARLESIRILLAISYANDFKLYQIDIKSAFLNGLINEEVYVAQPPRFIDFQKPSHVYKLKKALYGLKQAPKACSTSQNLCDDFAKIMHDEFKMTMMGELNFFLGFQIKQMEDEIFFNQSKYNKEMLRKFRLEDSKPTKTLMSMKIKLTKDDEADSMDSSKYQCMIGSLLYLIVSKPDIMFSVCLCARFQENPKNTHLEAVKRIFRYIRRTSHLGLWYPKGTKIETVVYANSDHAEAEYVSVGKACQQALWMKQALINYGIRLDNIPICATIKELST